MRTAIQSQAAYRWLKPSAIAAELACSRNHVLSLIHGGEFGTTEEGAVIDISKSDGQRPDYRVSPEAFERFKRQRRVVITPEAKQA